MAYYYNGRFSLDLNDILDEIIKEGERSGVIFEYKTEMSRRIPFTMLKSLNKGLQYKIELDIEVIENET